ncbi:response regulator transcription factor [Streptomyces sp. NPDC087428]|uniref:response regulator transcription factor n=1 Tax=Streptomyces sp. NPDC087428 TaxID=3365788 RepID=UPI0038304EAE
MRTQLHDAIRTQILTFADERELPLTVADVTALAESVHGAVLDAKRAQSPVQLTAQQISVLDGLARGDTPTDTARRMCISSNTVRTHRQAAYRRLKARSAGQAIALAITYGVLPGRRIGGTA